MSGGFVRRCKKFGVGGLFGKAIIANWDKGWQKVGGVGRKGSVEGEKGR